VTKLATDAISVQRNARTILEEITVSLKPGDLMGIVGPNGSGKSTLLRALAGLWQPSLGSVSLDGSPLTAWHRRDLARKIAFLPQSTHVDFAFTVRELVAMGRYPHRSRFSRESNLDRAAIDAALGQCDVQELADRQANTLSGGELQRVLLARCLAVEPDYVLLDEPTSNLDLEHSLDVLHICSRLCEQNKAVAITTHDLNSIARYASVLVLLQNGSLVKQGSADSVLTPSSIAQVFGVEAEILTVENGRPLYQFHKRGTRSLAR
jgi:iron complex transport system ATP-binding protein